MGFFDRFRPAPAEPAAGHATQNEVQVPRGNSVAGNDAEKGAFGTETSMRQSPSSERNVDSDSDDEVVHKDAQWGVQKAEAMCQAWGKKSLYATYGL